MGNAGLSNVDIPFISYLISLFKLYYPDLLNAIVVFELPFIMNGEAAHAGETETSGCFSNEVVAECYFQSYEPGEKIFQEGVVNVLPPCHSFSLVPRLSDKHI